MPPKSYDSYGSRGTRDLPTRISDQRSESSFQSGRSNSPDPFRTSTAANYAQADLLKHGINNPRIRRPSTANEPGPSVIVRNPDEIPLSSTEPSVKSEQDEDLPDLPRIARRKPMTKPVLFYGKPSQLPKVLTHFQVRTLVDSIGDESKAAALAETFRGAALDWLTAELASSPTLLDDYDDFLSRVKEAFELSDEAKAAQSARQLVSCRQKTSARDYAQRFRQLATSAGVPDATAVELFVKGLKPQIRNGLILNSETGTLQDAIAEATRLDDGLYYARANWKGKTSDGRGKSRSTSRKATTPGRNFDI